jgi:hypothetical protein
MDGPEFFPRLLETTSYQLWFALDNVISISPEVIEVWNYHRVSGCSCRKDGVPTRVKETRIIAARHVKANDGYRRQPNIIVFENHVPRRRRDGNLSNAPKVLPVEVGQRTARNVRWVNPEPVVRADNLDDVHIVTLRVIKHGVNEGAVAKYPYRLLQNGLVQGGDIRDDLRPRCNTQLPEDVRQGSRARSVRGGLAANVHASAVHFSLLFF